METGQLPTPRRGLRAAVVDNILYVTGGHGDGHDFYIDYMTILFWNSSTETWQLTSELAVGRERHAAVAVPSSIIESGCLETGTP